MDNSKMIRKKATEFTLGLMDVSIKAGGIRGDNMVSESIQVQTRQRSMVFGLMESEQSGLTIKQLV